MNSCINIICNIFLKLYDRCRVAWKSRTQQKKLNISITVRANELIILSAIEACSNFISKKVCLKRSFVKYIVFFLICERVKFFCSDHWWYLTNGLSRLVFTNINLEHASIIDKKIGSFAQTLMAILNFFVGCVTFGPLCSISK